VSVGSASGLILCRGNVIAETGRWLRDALRLDRIMRIDHSRAEVCMQTSTPRSSGAHALALRLETILHVRDTSVLARVSVTDPGACRNPRIESRRIHCIACNRPSLRRKPRPKNRLNLPSPSASALNVSRGKLTGTYDPS
jgi:hypothetical protein